LTGDLSVWYLKFVPELAKSYRVTTYDLRGHGLSERPRTGYNTDVMVEDLKALLDHLEVERTFLLGHSYGGIVVMAFAAKYPDRVRGAVIYDTGFPFLHRLHDYDSWHGWDTWKKEIEMLGIQRESAVSNPDIVLPKLARLILPFGLRAGKRRFARRMMKLCDETTILQDVRAPCELNEERLLAIAVPVLAVYGATSPVARVGRHLADHLPNCQLVNIEGRDHFFILVEPKQFLTLITEFFDRVVEEQEQMEGRRTKG